MAAGTSTDPRWSDVLDQIRREVNRQQFETWFRKVDLLSMGDDLVEIAVPSQFFKDWLTSYYLDVVHRAVKTVTGASPAIEFVIVEGLTVPAEPAAGPKSGPDSGLESGPESTPAGASVSNRAPSPTPGALSNHAPNPLPNYAPNGAPNGTPSWADPGPGSDLSGLRPSNRYPNFLSDILLNDHYTFDNFIVGPPNKL
ncbi:MAG: DnaA N-terminal domain-containing protein, partial [Planctomycetota bacterium]